jgi:RHH-type proline utilization regulon transcriptional repressor/proline dehydrogenase/delta 1-pyrroline-5-carboxylate dehydrogenase
MTQHLPTPYRPEAGIVNQCLASLTAGLDWPAAVAVARPWVAAVRRHPPPFWAMESLLREYPIDSAEGLALMRLAEALLRVPDAETAVALTADQLGRADFDGAPDSALARLSQAALALSKRFLPEPVGPLNADPAPGQRGGLLGRLGARTVVAAALRAVQLLGRQFVLGQDMERALTQAGVARHGQPGLRFSYDMLGEGARTEADATRYLESYRAAIASIASSTSSGDSPEERDGISIKLSALHPRYEDAQRERVLAELVPRVWQLCEQAARADINLTIDAEEVDRLELSLDVFEALARQVAREHPQWRGFGLALQAYQGRALELIAHVVALGRELRLHFMCRLVKGAYWDGEIKRAQELGLPHYPVFTHKHHTDISYLACARALLAAGDTIYPQFATHNAATIAALLQMAGSAEGARPKFELQRLHGMGEGIYRELSRQIPPGELTSPPTQPPPRGGGAKPPSTRGESAGPRVRIYAPVGQYRDLLAYLVRRLLENGANSSFVHQLADESIGMEQLLVSPLWLAPRPSLPLPPDLYGPRGRRNSQGLDLAVAQMREPLLAAHAQVRVPAMALFEVHQVGWAVDRAVAAGPQWNALSVAHRAAVLRRAADAMQAQLPGLCALLVAEAHKTWGDAIAEVREAVDFLRYYADEAERIMQPVLLPRQGDGGLPDAIEGATGSGMGAAPPGLDRAPFGVTGESNTLRLSGRGAWVCISPWNFPLAIFTGQVAAALVTGNSVLAKPAEQTPAVALEAVRLLHQCGVPAEVLQLLHGPGETVGAALVAEARIAGVVFTGSTQVARIIAVALAQRDGAIVPLIAETGGINAMLVDSTALPEQVADAVLQSAFRSAGQRCSALRLLCVHEGIADSVIEMVRGATRELVTGAPARLTTDVGPLIDREAFETIERHLAGLRASAIDLDPWVAGCAETGDSRSRPGGSVLLDQGIEDVGAPAKFEPPVARAGAGSHSASEDGLFFVAPQLFEVRRIADVTQEIFGPVLQVVRWSGDPLAVIDQINALGYGLTLGIQTRIDSRALALAQRARVGNVYVNRNMIGAVVGVQPFGGEGLSGSGPKAGGPNYLQRFCHEQTVTINTTAAGGNVALLA